MPPKKADNKPSKKNELKKKEKVIEDKTFGLKNKKGNKNQKYIAQVEKQVKSGGDPRAKKVEEERAAERKRKEDAKKEEEERKALFKPIVPAQKVESGVDPKSVFCAFFKAGLCKKAADKCKFSHDPDVERKSAKRSLYTDVDKDKENDNMEDWDEDKLAEVIGKKHGAEKTNETTIICKYFLEAVENNKYGWFWQCPIGGKDCKYRHALPPGFVLKKDKKKEDKKEETSIEELIEQKRIELSAQNKSLTPVNLQTFVAWKKRKLREKAELEKKDRDSKKKKMKEGLTVGMSGRDMFLFDPKMVSNEDDDEEGGEQFDLAKLSKDNAEENPEEEPVKVHEIKFDEYGIMDDGVDATTNEQLKALGAGADDGAAAIDEDLFDDEDLDELEEDLNNLEV